MYVRPKGLPIAPSALKVNFPTFNLLSRFQEFAIKYTTGGRRSNQYVVQAKLTRTRVISKTASPEAGCGICRQIASIESGGGFNQSLHRSSKGHLIYVAWQIPTYAPSLDRLKYLEVCQRLDHDPVPVLYYVRRADGARGGGCRWCRGGAHSHN